ncbi:Chorion peroxidase [Nymphon striatum]|nr:Chorion peroxidase [Nymphon striatum]
MYLSGGPGADSRMFLHVAHASRHRHEKILVRTVDTDVVVLAVAVAQTLPADSELWLAFGTGTSFRYLAAPELAVSLGPDKSRALPMFHALTGCDTVSVFLGHGKRTAWATWKAMPALTNTLLDLSSAPDDVPDDGMRVIERFVILIKLIGAILQSITYREYVPLVVGTAAMSKYDLTVGNVPDPTMYNPEINPAIRNSFSTAAFRFAHATIPSDFDMVFNDNTTRSLPIEQSFLEPLQFHTKYFDGILAGMTKQCAREASVFMASSVSKQLGNLRGKKPFGSDLGATNIQRGRDHGLPPWNEFREFCGFSKYNRFEEIPDIDPRILFNLKLSYEHVDDIDLFVGGLLEKPVAGGATGETFACLNAKQFEILKNGDRFFYTNGATADKLKGIGYSAAKIKELNKASLARLLCDFTNIEEIQPRVLEKANSCSNAVVKCDQIPMFSISFLMS